MSNCWKCRKAKHQLLRDAVQYRKSLGQERRNWSASTGMLPGEIDELGEPPPKEYL